MTRERQESGPQPSAGRTGLSNRAIGGIVIAVVLVVWIAVNRDTVEVSFVLGSADVPLWVALAIAALLGTAAGFLSARRRYRS